MSVPHDLMDGLERPSFIRALGLFDWLWAALVLASAVGVYVEFNAALGVYQQAILAGTTAALIGVGWYWKPMRLLSLVIAGLSLLTIALYGSQYSAGESNFILVWWLSSPAAIAWMNGLFLVATVFYVLGLAARGDALSVRSLALGSWLTWAAVTMGFVGLMVRWRESYLIAPDFGHIPVSNLFDVFVLFCVVTGLLYLYYETRYRQRALGALALLIISAAVAFLIYYSVVYHADKIEPLVPALKSYWMKIHVPANFIGYGSFAFSAMVGVAYLLRDRAERLRPDGRVVRRLPSLEILDDIMYRYIALGFAFFTLATILGALWAAQAWGGYWSWDPKETWALIVWLNYAAWLHMRFTKGWRGRPLAAWSFIGLIVTTFCFLGVNIFLSGLHSYGKL
ncbi:MAG: c-type cytochrome biogenesis protein CcsB [Acidihalobacter sp.]|uniref:c-type cytochrome biogenesis protein CcsB n=1 Tax=Acidihalobacter sp. TaxID=1872108 RepID=UPI00307DAF43